MKENKYYTGKLDYKCDVRLLLVHPISPRDGQEGPFHLPAYVYFQNIPVLELSSDEDRTVRELVKIGQSQINDNSADVLIPNCGYLGGLAQRLQMKLGVPVLANLDIALRLAELLAIFDIRPKLRRPKALEGLNTSRATKDANTSQKRGIASLVRSLVKRYF